ncbi:MAG: molybdenum cofactor guanylyltransferase [Thiotrichaceae bacterium]|nr:molybdenum cofactor guanylyltransferase [Thiotrichaceae bacterium]
MTDLSTEQITAIILAGGKGRRFSGNDKGLVLFKGKPLIKHLLVAMKPQVSSLLINANRNQETYAGYGYPVINDVMSDYQGPLAGFSVTMGQVDTSHIITLPCDGPFISSSYVERMRVALNQSDAELAVAHDGTRLQSVHALIPIALKDSLDKFLERGERKIGCWYRHHKIVKVDFSDSPELFQNINTAEQLTELESKA